MGLLPRCWRRCRRSRWCVGCPMVCNVETCIAFKQLDLSVDRRFIGARCAVARGIHDGVYTMVCVWSPRFSGAEWALLGVCGTASFAKVEKTVHTIPFVRSRRPCRWLRFVLRARRSLPSLPAARRSLAPGCRYAGTSRELFAVVRPWVRARHCWVCYFLEGV